LSKFIYWEENPEGDFERSLVTRVAEKGEGVGEHWCIYLRRRKGGGENLQHDANASQRGKRGMEQIKVKV